jgi:hypothetical protein
VVAKVTLGQVFLQAFSPVSIIQPLLHTHFHLYALLTRETSGRIWERLEKAMFFQISTILLKTLPFTFLVLQRRAIAHAVSHSRPTRRPGFLLELFLVGLAVAKVARSWASLLLLQLAPLRIIPQMLHT